MYVTSHPRPLHLRKTLTFRHRDILVDREQSEQDVVVAKPSKLQVLGGKNGETTFLDLVNVAGHGSAPTLSQVIGHPVFQFTGIANAQSHPIEMYRAPPGGYAPCGSADLTHAFHIPQGCPVYGRQGAQRGHFQPQYYGRGPASGSQAVSQFFGPAHTHDRPTYGEQLGMPPVGGDQFTRRNEATPQRQSNFPPVGCGPAQGPPDHGAQPLQRNDYDIPGNGYDDIHSERPIGQSSRRSRNAQSTRLRNAHEERHRDLPIPPTRQHASGVRRGLPRPQSLLNSSALSPTSASRRSSRPEHISAYRQHGLPSVESLRASGALPTTSGSPNSYHPEHTYPIEISDDSEEEDKDDDDDQELEERRKRRRFN